MFTTKIAQTPKEKICETCVISVFNVVHVGEKLLTYVCGSKDRQDSKCLLFHVSYTLGRAFHVSKINWSGFGRVSILLQLLGYQYVFAGFVGQFYFKIRLTDTFQCNAIIFSSDGSMLKGEAGKDKSFLNSQKRLPNKLCIAMIADCQYSKFIETSV